MSTESETKSAGVPAGATAQCMKCRQYWAYNHGLPYMVAGEVDHNCPCDDVRPIAEAGPAPTTAAPVEQLSGKVVEGQPPRECAFCDTTEVNGVNINECSSCLTLCCTAHSEDADNQRVLCINCAPEDEPVPAEQPGKAADPRPAQPQAPAEWRSPEYKLTLPELFDRATEWSTHRFALDFHAAAEHLRHPPEVAAPLREERDRLAGRLKALESRWKDASEQINAAKYMVEKARDCERAEKAVAERDTRIATLEQASWSFAEWAERAQCFGCDVEFSEDPEPDDTQPCECCESIRRSYRLVIAAIGRERVQSLRGRAALGAPEGQPPVASSEAPLRLEVRRLAEAFGKAGSEYERGGNTSGAAQLRRVSNLLYALWADGKAEVFTPFTCAEPEAPLDALREALLNTKFETYCPDCEWTIRGGARVPMRTAKCSTCAPVRAALSAPPPPPREQELLSKKGGDGEAEALLRELGVEASGGRVHVVKHWLARASAPPRKAPQEGCKACALVAKEFGTDKCPWCGRPFGTTVGYVEKCSAMHHAVRSAMGLDKPAYDARPSSPEEQLSGKELK